MVLGMIRLGVDIGGTFTDFALIDRTGRRTAVHKRLTTPADPARAVIEGVAAIAEENRIAVGEIGEIVHGTTLVTNALLERRGARVGMLVTAGFRDTFDIGQEQRYDLYDLRLRFAEPLVPRRLRVEVDERMRHDGTVITPLDPAEIRAAVARLVAEDGIEALAICFLHAYANPAHEEAARAAIAAAHPGLYLSHSAGVFPYAREFERWTTTCANAYAQPMVDAYLGRLQAGLGAIGFRGHLAVIGSSGGLLSVDTARRFPVRLLESGPAAGVLMSARLGRELAIDSLLSFDLGGTTAKGALVRHGAAFKKYSFEAAHAYKYRSGSGLTLQIPVIDMSEIGAGGGSIVAVDELGLLRVGPRSAGADPGPACYGRGGQDATLSDANLALGYLDAGFFLGGKMRLDPALATQAIREKAARPLDLDLIRAAWGIHDIANEDISRAFRMHATERGFDYRRSGMIAFGGGGPIHAARIARKLKVPRVIYPAGAGVMSAFGMLVGAVSFEVMRSGRRALSDLTGPMLAATLAPLEAEASSYLLATGLRPDQIRLDRRVDMRYRGQGYDLEVRLPGGMSADDLIAGLPALHAEAYREVFHMVLDQPLEIVSWKVEARGPEPDLPAPEVHPDRRAAVDALKGSRPAFFPAAGGLIDCPVYDRYALRPGDAILGPCLVEERESTCLLDVGDEGQIDAMGNLVSRIAI
jgi:N-methylhydantoinase A